MHRVGVLVLVAGCAQILGIKPLPTDASMQPGDTGSRDADHANGDARVDARTDAPPDGPTVLPTSCRDAQTKGGASDGVVTIDVDGPGGAPPQDVYCDMTTAGGGWMLVWVYGFTDYLDFNHSDNAVTPIPSWGLPATNSTPVSTTTPTSPTTRGAMQFDQWASFGAEFLVTSNINNWVDCTPANGSLMGLTPGSVNCTLVNVLPGITCMNVPNTLLVQSTGPSLTAGGLYYFFDGSTTTSFPTHDPCGSNGPNQLSGVTNPGGAIYVR